MVVENVKIDTFIQAVMKFKNSGFLYMDIEISPENDAKNSRNIVKLTPIEISEVTEPIKKEPIVVKNPIIDPNSDDIFRALNNLL
jgi:hypothetical protein